MPSLLKLSDSTLPALSYRRVWASPEVMSHSLAVLTLTRLHLAPPSKVPPSAEQIAEIESGEHEGGLGPDAIVIDLATVRRVRLDMIANVVELEYLAGRLPHVATVRFASPESADTLFTKVWHRLGADFQLVPFQVSPWVSVRGPLAVTLGLLAGTALAAVALATNAEGGTDSLPWWLDWRYACVAGGAAMAAVQVWVYRRWTEPAARLELIRASE